MAEAEPKYRSDLNMKYGCMSHLYWGFDLHTKQIRHINSVKTRGLACNCNCPVCGGAYIACLGEKVRPYFKHKSKYKCMYTDEITTYLRMQALLKKAKTIHFPEFPVHFKQFDGYLCHPGRDLQIDAVYYHCDEEQYPPVLIAECEGRPLRIILNFKDYYGNHDIDAFAAECEAKGWDCLMVDLPRPDSDNGLSNRELKACLNSKNSTVVYAVRAKELSDQLDGIGTSPTRITKEWEKPAFKCALHKRFSGGTYYAMLADCKNCDYNLGWSDKCICAVDDGIRGLADLEAPKEIRMQKVMSLRQAYEQEIEKRRVERQRREALARQEQERRQKAAQAEKERREMLAEQARRERERAFYQNRTCPNCGTKLLRRDGKAGINWLCTKGCGFHAFENFQTGEIILAQR